MQAAIRNEHLEIAVKSKGAELASLKSRRSVTVFFEGFPYLAFWSPAAGGALCIESWQGVLPTKGVGLDLREKEGIDALDAGREARCSFRIVIR